MILGPLEVIEDKIPLTWYQDGIYKLVARL